MSRLKSIAVTLVVVATVVMGLAWLLGDTFVEHGNVAYDVSPDGQSIVFSSAGGDLFLLDLGTKHVTQLTETSDEESTPAFSPDGKSIVFARGRTAYHAKSIYVLSLGTKAVERLTDDPDVYDGLPTFSPDGKRVAFVRSYLMRGYSMGGWTWNDWDVCVMQADGTNLKRWTEEKYYSITTPHFSPVGARLVYSAIPRGVGATKEAFELSAEREIQPLEKRFSDQKRHGAWASGPSYSPDGKLVALISDRKDPFQYDIWLVDRATRSATPLNVTSVSRYNQNPVFAPDGKSIYFLAATKRNYGGRGIYSLWKVNTSGKNPEQIADSRLFTSPRNWQPKEH